MAGPPTDPRTTLAAAAGIGLLVATGFLWDLTSPLGYAPWLLYFPALLLTLLLPYRWDVPALACLGTILLWSGYAVSLNVAGTQQADFFNRAVGNATLWFMAGCCLLYKQTAAGLARQEREFHVLANHVPAYFSYVDRDYRYRFVNQAYEPRFGRNVQAIVGRTVEDLVGKDNFERLRPFLDTCLAGQSVSFEYPFQSVDLTPRMPRIMHVNYLPDRDEDGTVRGCFALVVDVTEQREAERRLEQLQQQRTAILLAAGAGIYGLDLDGRVTFLNRAATLIAGWQEWDLIGQPMHPRLHHSHADGAPYDPEACPIYRTIKTGVSSQSDQDVFWGQDGTNFPVEYCSSPIRLEDGSVRGVVVTFRDITERRRTEQALRESEARFRAIFEQAAVGVAQIDTRTGRFLRVNRKYGEIVGLSETAMIESTFMALTHPEDLPADLDNMARLVAGKIRTFTMDKRYLRPDGSTVWVALTVSPLWAPGEHPDAHIAVVEDITVRKQTEERLSQSRAHLQALAAHVESVREGERTRIARELHDEVGQALAGFKMGLAHLAKGMEALPDGGQPVHLPTLLTQARDMQSTVDACVRDIRRLVTELRPPVLDHLDLPDALEWLAKDFHRRHGLPCRFTCDAPPGKMSLDAKTALFRIAQEALTNVTRHAQAAQAHIHLTHGADLQLTIDDDGRGLDAAAGENPLSFGLTGIRERARLLGGHADFLGRPGKGTQVIVHIPLQETP